MVGREYADGSPVIRCPSVCGKQGVWMEVLWPSVPLCPHLQNPTSPPFPFPVLMALFYKKSGVITITFWPILHIDQVSTLQSMQRTRRSQQLGNLTTVAWNRVSKQFYLWHTCSHLLRNCQQLLHPGECRNDHVNDIPKHSEISHEDNVVTLGGVHSRSDTCIFKHLTRGN